MKLTQGPVTSPAALQPDSTTNSKAYSWLVVGMLWIVSFFNYADRNAVNAIMPTLKHDFLLSDVQLGLLSTTFLLVYAVSNFFSGFLGDRFKRKHVILFGLVFWSCCTFLSPVLASFAGFIVMRSLTGLGEATYYPSATALISDYHNGRTRSTALSLHQTAVFIGGLVGTTSVAYLAEHYNWRLPFYLYGALGVTWAVILAFALKNHPETEVTRLASRAQKRAEKDINPYRTVFGVPSALLLFGVFFLATFVTQGLTTWMPTYLYRELHLPLTDSAFFGSVQNISSMVAVLAGGVLGDVFSRRFKEARFMMLGGGLLLAACFVAALGFARHLSLIVVCLSGAGFFKGIFDANIYAAMHDVMPAKTRATAVGVMTAIGFAGAGLAPTFIGALTHSLGLGLSFSSSAIFYVLGGLGIVIFLRIVRRDINRNNHA
jgi:MFS family permease